MKRLLLSLFTAAATVMSAFAADQSVTVTTTNKAIPYTSQDNIITITSDKGSGSQPGGSTSAQYRLYNGNTLTISAAEGYVITGMTSTASSSGYQLSDSKASCAQGSVIANGVTLPAPVQTMVLNFTGEVRFKTMKITYRQGESGPTKTGVVLAWSEQNAELNLGDAFTAPTLSATVDGVESPEAKAAVVYTSNNETLLQVATDGTMTLMPDVDGTATITASIPTENDTYTAVPVEFTLTVIDPAKAAYTDNITYDLFGNKVNTYTVLSYTSPNTRVKYSAKCYTSNSNIQINTTTSGNTIASGIVSTENPNNLFIEKVVLKTASAKANLLFLSVSNTPGSATADKTTTTSASVTPPTDAIEVTGTEKSTNSDNTEVTFTPSGDFKFLYIKSSGSVQIVNFDVYYKVPSDPSKENVNVSFSNNSLTLGFEADKQVQGLTATTDVEGMEVTYTSSDVSVAEVDASTGMLTLKGVGTTMIKAATAETEKYNSGSASYILTVEKVYNSFADILNGAANNETVKINFETVAGCVIGSNCYVTDGKGGYMLIYGTTPYKAGNVIPAGWSATYFIYSGLPELKITDQSSLPESTSNGKYVIETVAAADVMSQPLNKIVIIEGVTFDAQTPATAGNFNGTAGTETLPMHNSNKLASVDAGEYNVTAAVSTFKSGSTTILDPNQLVPVAYAPRPAAPVVTLNGTELTDGSLNLEQTTKTIVITVAEGNELWYRFITSAVNNTPATAAETESDYEGFTKAEGNSVELQLSTNGTVEYFSVLNGVRGALQTLSVEGAAASIADIRADETGVSTWFDLQGRRVSTPRRGGIYIKKTGSETSKHRF